MTAEKMRMALLQCQRENKALKRELEITKEILNENIHELLEVIKDYDKNNACVMQKNTEMQLLLQDLHEMAFNDHLTGLLNRRGFEKALHRQVNLIQRYTVANNVPFVPPTLLVIDLDHFKKVNDSKGHDVGDIVLKTFAKKLTEVFHRTSDIISRFGGDEFVVLCTNTVSKEQGVHCAERLRRAVEEEPLFDFGGFRVTVSIGLTVLNIKQCTVPEEIDQIFNESIKKADGALYVSKEAGKNTLTADLE